MPDHQILALELQLKEVEAKLRKQDALVRELMEALRGYDDWYRSVYRQRRPPIRRRLLPSGWRLLIVGPRYQKKRWQA